MGVIKRTYDTGNTVYGIQWTDGHGRRERLYDRTWTKRSAEAEYAKVMQRIRDGVAPRQKMTVHQLYEEWRDNHLVINCSPSHVNDCENNFRLRIEPMIGHRTIDTINRRLVRAMVAQMKAVMQKRHPGNEYAGHRTINKTLANLKGMLSYAVSIDELAHNPAHGVPALSENPQRQIEAWPLEVVRAVAMSAMRLGEGLPDFQRAQRASWAGERDFTIIMLAALTGLRQSELLGLRWEQIDNSWLHVTHKLCRTSFTRRETKSRRGRRRVPLLSVATQLLEQWYSVGADPEIVFPNQVDGGYQRAQHFSSKMWDKARKRTEPIVMQGRTWDPANLTFHELRHSFISICLAAGRDVWEVANWAGDDPDLVKRVYGHYIPDSLGDTTRLDLALSTTAPLPIIGPGSQIG